MKVGFYAVAGWKDPPPSTPAELDEVDPGAWKPAERLRRMDEYGIHTRILYPNLIGFEAPHFMRLAPELSLACSSPLTGTGRATARPGPDDNAAAVYHLDA